MLHALSVLPSGRTGGVTCKVDNGPNEGTPLRDVFQAGGADRGRGTPAARKRWHGNINGDGNTNERQGAVVRGREIRERIPPRTAGTRTGGHGAAASRYRGVPTPDTATARAQQALATLAQLRTTIALRSSRVRALTTELGDCIAQALRDGVNVAALAEAAGQPAGSIRSAAVARGELYPSGQTRNGHVHIIKELATELAAAEGARSAAKEERTQVLALARKSRLLDDYQLAGASGLKSDEIRKMTRGVGLRVA
ncbi:hypothetical protein [Arthrobacter bambusae]|uniref:hypothetical protein n=1 Tax=Arthrobacter bambusae TaxID=1338426 RepID=UPI00278238A0|nr:hypothetical protein [Arthrobacter bambusae]MDQ0031682.1 hypothetical protein [Arthrobacter bambusae]MDQ0098777.1 hypothetical protein [Arthrobacter bambusae]